MLFHKDCGGQLSVDITEIISWKSPSTSITVEGIKIGVTEFRGNPDVDLDKATFCCEKCDAQGLKIKDLEDFAAIDCPICGDKVPLSDLMVARSGFALCSSCLKIAKKEKTTKKEKILKVVGYFNLSGSGLTFRPFSEMVAKKITF